MRRVTGTRALSLAALALFCSAASRPKRSPPPPYFTPVLRLFTSAFLRHWLRPGIVAAKKAISETSKSTCRSPMTGAFAECLYLLQDPGQRHQHRQLCPRHRQKMQGRLFMIVNASSGFDGIVATPVSRTPPTSGQESRL